MRDFIRGGGILLTVWELFFVPILLWILGLALGWGGWIWFLFAIGLVALVANVLAVTGRRRRVK
jgi:hypothetical protein